MTEKELMERMKRANSKVKEDREYASAGFEPKTIDELLAHEREYIKNTPLSEEPYFKAVAESLNNKELWQRESNTR